MERKKAGKEPGEKARILMDILNKSPAVIFLKDVNGRYIFVNALYEKLFHVSNKKISGKTDYDIFPKEAADSFRNADFKVLKANQPLEIEETVPQDDGIHYYISSKFPLYNEDKKLYAVCGIATDITGRKKAEEELKQKTEELEKFNKFAVGRELKMVELKKEVNELLRQIGRPPKYPEQYEPPI